MKTVIILDHMAQHDLAPPGRAMIKSRGHNLKALFDYIRRLRLSSARHPLEQVEVGSIEHDILEHLTDFANGARYFNLDNLSAVRPRVDPLARWSRVLARILVEDVPARRRARLRLECKATVAAAADDVRMIMHDLEREPLSFEKAVEVSTLTYAAGPYAIYRIHRLLEPLRTILENCTNEVMNLDHSHHAAVPSVPFMHEFLEFGVLDKQTILRKRKWL